MKSNEIQSIFIGIFLHDRKNAFEMNSRAAAGIDGDLSDSFAVRSELRQSSKISPLYTIEISWLNALI